MFIKLLSKLVSTLPTAFHFHRTFGVLSLTYNYPKHAFR